MGYLAPYGYDYQSVQQPLQSMQQSQQPAVYSQRGPLPLGLYIFNIPVACTEEILIQLFSAYGGVSSCKIMVDQSTGLGKGFGFVNMVSEQASNNAIAALNGLNWGGKILKVQFQNPKQPR